MRSPAHTTLPRYYNVHDSLVYCQPMRLPLRKHYCSLEPCGVGVPPLFFPDTASETRGECKARVPRTTNNVDSYRQPSTKEKPL